MKNATEYMSGPRLCLVTSTTVRRSNTHNVGKAPPMAPGLRCNIYSPTKPRESEMGKLYRFERHALPLDPLADRLRGLYRRCDAVIDRSREIRMGLVGPQKLRVVLAGDGREDSVLDARGQVVRPLVDGLVGDPDGVGCRCDRPAQEFDGFGLEHGRLNHSSDALATIVHASSASSRTMVATTFADRLALAMGVPSDPKAHTDKDQATKKALAKQLGITYQAIQKYFDDTSGAMSAKNCLKAASHLKVDAQWLATGEGRMRSDAAWPFGNDITPDQFYSLDEADVRPVVDLLRGALQRQAESQPAKRAAKGKK